MRGLESKALLGGCFLFLRAQRWSLLLLWASETPMVYILESHPNSQELDNKS